MQIGFAFGYLEMMDKKMAKMQELRDLDLKELKNKSAEIKKELMNLRFQKSTGQLEVTDRFRKLRREVARVKTMMNQKMKSV